LFKQTTEWASKFGEDYTNRNDMTINEMDDMYLKRYGITRSQMNSDFLDGLSRDLMILEVGSNIGLQLQFLQSMGFKNLYGIETKGINIIRGDVFDIPFKDNYFDLVFTSGVLIHINPLGLRIAMNNIVKASRKYIWGFEYYAAKLIKVKYRKSDDLLWKDNFVDLYCENCNGLKITKQNLYPLQNEDNIDTMFLLEKL
jgi:pseudaminic acid biosynthesis-associated methylase